MDIDGTKLTQLTINSASCSHPTWSNNHEKIAFVSEMDGNRELYMVNVDSSNLQRLTNNELRILDLIFQDRIIRNSMNLK